MSDDFRPGLVRVAPEQVVGYSGAMVKLMPSSVAADDLAREARDRSTPAPFEHCSIPPSEGAQLRVPFAIDVNVTGRAGEAPPHSAATGKPRVAQYSMNLQPSRPRARVPSRCGRSQRSS